MPLCDRKSRRLDAGFLLLSSAVSWALLLPGGASRGQDIIPYQGEINFPNCSPSDNLFLKSGGTLNCSGEGPGVSLPGTEFELRINEDGDREIKVATDSLTDVTATLAAGASITSVSDGFFATNANITLINNGSIVAQSGMTGLASNATLTNNGDITASGDVDGPEGLGVSGNRATLTNSATGTITVDGPFAEGMGIDGNDGIISNAFDLAVAGDGAVGMSIDGTGALLENLATGTVLIGGDQGSAGIGIFGDGGRIENAGNVLLNGQGHVGIGTFGIGNEIDHSGSVFSNGATDSLGIGVVGPLSSLTLDVDSVIETGPRSVNILLAGDASEGTDTVLNLVVGNGASLTTSADADVIVGPDAIGLFIAHNGANLGSLPSIQSIAPGAVGAALYGQGIDLSVESFASLLGDGSTLLALGTNAGAAPGFAVVGGETSGAVVSFATLVNLLGEAGTILDAAGDDHRVTVEGTGNLRTTAAGTAIRIAGDRAVIETAAGSLIEGGVVEVVGDTPRVTHRGRLERAGVSVDNSFGVGPTLVEQFGTIDLLSAAGKTAMDIVGGFGSTTVAIGGPSEIGIIEGSEGDFGVDVASQAGDVSVSLGADSRISMPKAAALRIRASSVTSQVTVDAQGQIEANSGISIAAGDEAAVTTNALTVTENIAWIEGTSDTGIAVEVEAERIAFTAERGLTAVSSASPGFDRAAVSLTGPEDRFAERIDLDWQLVGGSETFTVTGPLLSGIRLAADAVEGALLLPGFNVIGTGPNPIFGIDAATVQNTSETEARAFDLRVGSLALPMSWAVESAAEAVGYRVTAEGGDPRLIAVNAADLTVTSPVQPTGIRVDANFELLAPAADSAEFAFFPSRRGIANDAATISLVGGSNAIGMHVAANANGVRVENAGAIVASAPGPGARGIVVENARRNLIINGGQILIGEGEGIRGIAVEGSANVVLNGSNDAANVPTGGLFESPFGFFFGDTPPFGIFTSISGDFDFITASQDVFPALGEIVVSGPGAVGIDVVGENNIVATVFGKGIDPLGAPITDIVATGAGAIGVRMAGDGNVFANYGNVQGTAFSVQGDDGRQTVYNGAFLVGDVALGGGDDAYGFPAGAAEQPRVDAGSETSEDLLYTFNPIGTDPQATDFSRFVNFERFLKAGSGVVILEGGLEVPLAEVKEGTLEFANGAITGDLDCIENGVAITGSGVVGGDLFAAFCDVAPGVVTLNQAPAALAVFGTTSAVAEATSAHLSIGGDLTMEGGTIALSIASAEDFDTIAVGGSVDLTGVTLRLSLKDGFVPGPDDRFDFFAGATIASITGTTLVVEGADSSAEFVPDGTGGLQVLFDVAGPASGHVIIPMLGMNAEFAACLSLAIIAGRRLRRISSRPDVPC